MDTRIARWVPTESILADNRLYRVGAVATILGVIILLVRQTTELMHPMGHPGNTPEDAAASFADYAAHEHWVAAHLLEFLGFAFVFGALVVVSWRLRFGRGRGWALLGALGAGVSLSLAAALQAVDGIALKVMVDRWADAPAESRDLLLEGAYAVRQIEGGLQALLFVVLGLTVFLYGIALVSDEGAPSWLGVMGIAASPLTVATGVVGACALRRTYRGSGSPGSLAGDRHAAPFIVGSTPRTVPLQEQRPTVRSLSCEDSRYRRKPYPNGGRSCIHLNDTSRKSGRSRRSRDSWST
jgi:hypothetical protein